MFNRLVRALDAVDTAVLRAALPQRALRYLDRYYRHGRHALVTA